MSDSDEVSTRPPGYYDDGTGTRRWWSGRDWTSHVQEASAEPPSRQMTAHPQANDPATIWSAVGRPLKGFGGGKYRLTADMLFFERGTLSTDAQQISTWQIHDVDATQSITQKARGIGSIRLHARRMGRVELVTMDDVENFREGVRLVNEIAYAAGVRKRQQENTQHINYSGAPLGLNASPLPEASPAASPLMSELTKLAELKQAGLLTDEEFASAKARLLGL